jgi:hypothetical protein
MLLKVVLNTINQPNQTIPDLILKLYLFISFFKELLPLQRAKWYQIKQEQWKEQQI